MKHKNWITFLLAATLALYLSVPVYANSSWHWVTKSPLSVLPWAVCITLVVEILAICLINQLTKPLKASIVIVFANLVSFLLPFVFIGLVPVVGMEDLGFFASIHAYMDKAPFYIVGFAFLLLTLLAEIPIVYNLTKKDTTNKKRLFISIALVNCITTLAVAMMERIFCKGSW